MLNIEAVALHGGTGGDRRAGAMANRIHGIGFDWEKMTVAHTLDTASLVLSAVSSRADDAKERKVSVT